MKEGYTAIDMLNNHRGVLPEGCLFCGDRLSEEDRHDSKLIGTLPRCRAHILAVAPEMVTAEQAWYGVAA